MSSSRHITGAPWLKSISAVTSKVQRKETHEAKAATMIDRDLAYAAIDFFYMHGKLGSNLLARRIGWRTDVKTVLKLNPIVSEEQLEQLARGVNLSLAELLEIGKNPPLERGEEFKSRFKQMDLYEPKKNLPRSSRGTL